METLYQRIAWKEDTHGTCYYGLTYRTHFIRFLFDKSAHIGTINERNRKKERATFVPSKNVRPTQYKMPEGIVAYLETSHVQ